MATVTKGKFKGQTVTLSQWANDWFTVKEMVKIFSPTMLLLTSDEFSRVCRDKHSGNLLAWYRPVTVNGGWVFRKR